MELNYMMYPEEVYKQTPAETTEQVELGKGYIHCNLRVFGKDGESQLIFGDGGFTYILVTELKPNVYRYEDCIFFHKNKIPAKFDHEFEPNLSKEIIFQGKTHDEVALMMRIRIYNLGASAL